MEQTKILKQMTDFNKLMFEKTFESVSMIQDKTDEMTKKMMDQNAWIPAESKKAAEEWSKMFKKGRTDFKKAVDDGFAKMEESMLGAAA